MSICKRYSDKTKCMYFMIKDENIFDKYMTICGKVRNIIKKIKSEFIYNKKYIKLKKDSTQKKAFNVI